MHNNLVNVDLNLLPALDALLETESVSAAADRMHLSEPAMSRALGRIRSALGDPILVRSGRTMVPTPRAIALRAEIHQLLARAEAVFTPPGPPDLSTLERTFTLQSSDIAVAIGVDLLKRMREAAPGVRLRLIAEGPASESDHLRDGSVDLDVGVVGEPTPEIRTEHLGTDRMISVVRAGHPLTRGPLALADFAAAEHVSASRRGKMAGPLDDLLAEHGLARRVAVAAPTFAAALFMVAASDLVGLGSERLGAAGAAALGLQRLDLPFEMPPMVLGMAWHVRYDTDGAHQWLRACVRETVHATLAR